MLFFYLRHADPIYSPDSLTALGARQAEALAKRLALYGIDKIYTSTSERARLTAKPTCELLKKEAEPLDFTNEGHAWSELTVETPKGRRWLFAARRNEFHSREIRELGFEWYRHPEYTSYEAGINRIYDGADELFSSLGYEHERYTGRYRVKKHSNERVALFAHQGFGLAFLSCVLDIPYPQFSTAFDMGHTGMTVIEFADNEGFSIPKVLCLSSDSHLYREGLPTKYQNSIYF